MTIRGNKINLKSWHIAFLVIPFFRPEVIDAMYETSIINIFFMAWRTVSFCLIVCLYLTTIIKPSKITIMVLLFELVMLASSVVNHIPLSSRIITFANSIGIFMLVELLAKRFPQKMIRNFYWVFMSLIMTNALFTIILPHGFNQALSDNARINFLGKDNTITLIFLLCLVLSALYNSIRPNSISPRIALIAVLLPSVFYFSGSGIVSMIVVVLYIFFARSVFFVKVLNNPVIILTVFTSLEIMFVFLQQQSFFSIIIENVLGKDLTFTDRIYYWREALRQIQGSLWLGTGSGLVDLWGGNNYAHNAVLDIVLKGGLIALSVFGMLLIFVARSIKSIENKLFSGFISAVLFAFLLIGLMEGLEDRTAFWGFLAIATSVKCFEKENLINDVMFRIPRIVLK